MNNDYNYPQLELLRQQRAARHEDRWMALYVVLYFALVTGVMGAAAFMVIKLVKWAWYF